MNNPILPTEREARDLIASWTKADADVGGYVLPIRVYDWTGYNPRTAIALPFTVQFEAIKISKSAVARAREAYVPSRTERYQSEFGANGYGHGENIIDMMGR